VRESDTVARLGGDEFAVLITNIEGTTSVDAVIEKLRASIELSFELEGQETSVSVSIGAALYPEHGDTPDLLYRHADTHMYHSKHRKAQGEKPLKDKQVLL
jgi:diguanylate cyclase (GGDEF)-like protein